MAIRIEAPGLGGMYGRAAVLAGRGAARRQEEAWKYQAAREAAERTMRQYDRGQQVQLALLRMNNANEMAVFREEMDLRTRKEAQLFQLETIKTRANLDFAREERDRQQLQDEVKQGLRAISEYPYMSDEEKAEASYKFQMRKQYGYTVPAERALSTRERELQLIEQIIGTPGTTGAPTGAPTAPPTAAAKTWGWPTLFEPAYRVRSEQAAEAPTGPPTADELRRQNTQEAWQLGISLGYWK